MDRIASETLDNSFRTALAGESKEFRESSSSLMFAMILALFMIYLVLAAQFESFKDPLVVMFTVPLAIAGALIFMSYSDITMNIFSQIGIIMLIGLVAKNGILIVEFAKEEVEKGRDVVSAALKAAHLRFRPIVMTSLAFILGLLPLVFASGPGSASRQGIGTGVFFGMLVAISVGIVFVPFFFVWIYRIKAKLKKRRNNLP